MRAMPSFLLLAATVALGVLLGLDYLRGERSKPLVIGAHLVLGAIGVESFVMLLRGAPDGSVLGAGPVGNAAAGLLAVAMMSGLIAPIIGRNSTRTMNTALVTHIGLAAGGVLLFVGWMLSL
jgi:hypothetical protein